ncbi:leucine-rich PPR motif-containing protein, mitochondrial isoform X2 [Athalia rosae]|uniref:leucine-rich PPR motif-containing protein, mitochondrial isoform X2 n=1 Tax=Athalia rosae TaxID=37344 RepID=UPI0020334AAA|nr:leucine-rich PPR motif-containing protein, mitochondrial isoform X2 [Athalia rosae]
MTTLLRSAKCVRNYIKFATKSGFSHLNTNVGGKLFSYNLRLYTAPSSSARSPTTPKAAEQSRDNPRLEVKLQLLDNYVKQHGVVSTGKLRSLLRTLNESEYVTSTQGLMLLRCCGDLMPNELPETKCELVNQIWKNLEKSVELDLAHYNALLRVYNENGYAFSPTEVLAEMQRKGIEPNKLTYQRLINYYCQQGDIDGAGKILAFMNEKGIPLNENIFTALVRGHSEANDMTSAADILSVMKQAGLEPTGDTYKELLCGYAKQGDMESITRTLTECQSKKLFLLHTDLLHVIHSLACNGHGQHIETILSIMPKGIGYLRDMLSHILKLIYAGQVDAATQVLASIQRREKGTTGAQVIAKLAEVDLPLPKLIDLVKQIVDKGIHSNAPLIVLERFLRNSNIEGSLAFMKFAKESGSEIREHYFWPILVALGKSQNNEGTMDLLKAMRDEYGLLLSNATVRNYVLRYKTGEPDEIFAQLKEIYNSPPMAAFMTVQHLISEKDLKAAADFAKQHELPPNSTLHRDTLVASLKHTKDVTSFVSIIDQMSKTLSESENDNKSESPVVANAIEAYLNSAAIQLKTENLDLFIKVLEELHERELQVSDTCISFLLRNLADRMTPKLQTILNKLSNKYSTIIPIRFARNKLWAIARLEKSLEKLNSDDEAAIDIKKDLIRLYSYLHDLPNVIRIAEDFQKQGVEFTADVYKQLLLAYAVTDQLDKIEEYLAIVKKMEPEYTLTGQKSIHYITLLINSDRTEDALKFLQEINTDDTEPNYWPKLLSSIAQLGDPEALETIYKVVLEKDVLDINSQNLRPLIKVHFVRNDFDAALNAMEKICEKYRCTPMKNELAKKLIETENAAALQRLTDISSQVHGEINSLYDLVQSFIECNFLRQAKKILEISSLHPKFMKLKMISQRYSNQGATDYSERLVSIIKEVPFFKSMPEFYGDLLNCYDIENKWEKALSLRAEMEQEDIQPSEIFNETLNRLLQRNGQLSIKNDPTSSVAKNSSEDSETINQPIQRNMIAQLENLLRNGKLEEVLESIHQLVASGKFQNLRTCKIFLKKLSDAGDIEFLQKLEKHLPKNKKVLINFENYFCKAHLVKGQSAEYLDLLDTRFGDVDSSYTREFPMTSIQQILQSHPELVDKYTQFAEKQAERGFLQPINMLWIHYFLNESEKANPIWTNYLIGSPFIAFHPILQNATRTNNPELIKRLLKTLETWPNLNTEAKKYVYTTLIKLYDIMGHYQDSINVLQELTKVLPPKDVPLELVKRMKSHLSNKEITLPDHLKEQIETVLANTINQRTT